MSERIRVTAPFSRYYFKVLLTIFRRGAGLLHNPYICKNCHKLSKFHKNWKLDQGSNTIVKGILSTVIVKERQYYLIGKIVSYLHITRTGFSLFCWFWEASMTESSWMMSEGLWGAPSWGHFTYVYMLVVMFSFWFCRKTKISNLKVNISLCRIFRLITYKIWRLIILSF